MNILKYNTCPLYFLLFLTRLIFPVILRYAEIKGGKKKLNFVDHEEIWFATCLKGGGRGEGACRSWRARHDVFVRIRMHLYEFEDGPRLAAGDLITR